MTKAVFLDRDGVINELIYYEEHGIVDSPFIPEQMRVFPWVSEAIKRLRQLGYKVVVVSNQPGVAKGHFSWETFEKIRRRMLLMIEIDGAKLDGEYYCFHHPEAKVAHLRKNCSSRKPQPGLLLRAAAELDIDLKNSWMVGDGIVDIKAGREAGCGTIFIGRMKCDICHIMMENGVKPDFTAIDVLEAAKILEATQGISEIQGPVSEVRELAALSPGHRT